MKKYIIIIIAVVLCAVLSIAIFLSGCERVDDTVSESSASKTVVEEDVELDFSGVEGESNTESTQNPYDKDNDGYVDGWY